MDDTKFNFNSHNLDYVEFFEDKLIIVRTEKENKKSIPKFLVYQFEIYREENQTSKIKEFAETISYKMIREIDLFDSQFTEDGNKMVIKKFERISLIKKDPLAQSFTKENHHKNYIAFLVEMTFDNRCDKRNSGKNDAKFISEYMNIADSYFKKRKEDFCNLVGSVRNKYSNVVIFRHDLPSMESFQVLFNSNECVEMFMGPALITNGNSVERSLNFLCLHQKDIKLIKNGMKKYEISILNDVDLMVDFNTVSAPKDYFTDNKDNRSEENQV